MKFFLFPLATVIILISAGCLKDNDNETCTPRTVQSDMAAMNKFASDSGIVAQEDASGLLYQIINSGSGTTPTLNSTITVKYVGKLLNGQKFDSTATSASFPLNVLIEGWKIGVPKIKKGGRIKLIVPSALAYGCYPPNGAAFLKNQPLYFNIELLDVQ